MSERRYEIASYLARVHRLSPVVRPGAEKPFPVQTEPPLLIFI